MNIFEQLKAAAMIAVRSSYTEIAAAVFASTLDSLEDWREVDPIEVGYDEDSEAIFAKRVVFPLIELLPVEIQMDYAHEMLQQLDLAHSTYSYTFVNDYGVIAYLSSHPVDENDLRTFFGDFDEEDDEEEEEDDEPETGAPSRPALVMVPPISQAPADEESEPFMVEEPFVVEAQSETQAPAAEPETPAQPTAEVEAPAATVEAETPAPVVDTQAEAETTQEAQPEAQAETDADPVESVVHAGPVQEDAETLEKRYEDKLLTLLGRLPTDTLAEMEDGKLMIVYQRPVGADISEGTTDAVCRVSIKNEPFPPVGPVRFVDFYYMEDEHGDQLTRATNEQAIIDMLNSLMGL